MANAWFWVRIGGQGALAVLASVSWGLESNDAAALTVEGATLDWWLVGSIAVLVFLALSLFSQFTQEYRLDNRKRFKQALDLLTPSIDDAQAIIDECGRPRDQMQGAPPTYFLTHCLPKINTWVFKVLADIESVVPEYRGEFQHFGNVTYGTDEKAAAVQALEKRLENLAEITDDLRKRAFDA